MRDWAEPRSPDTTSRPRGVAGLASLAAICVLVAVLSVHFVEWVTFALEVLRYPYDIDYGEGVVWQQALMILRGDGYTPLNTEPHIVFHYPPVYHLAAGLAAQIAGDFLIGGRLVSIISTLAAAFLLAALVQGSAIPSRAAGRAAALGTVIVVALLFLNHPVVVYWSVAMRVDMLALTLGLLGAWFGLRAPERPGMVWPAALFLALSLYTKQSYVALPAATLGVLFLASPGHALRFIAIIASFGFGTLALLQVATDGGFLTHVIGYNLNRINFPGTSMPLIVMLTSFALVAIGAVAGLAWAGRLMRDLICLGTGATRRVLRENPAERIRVFATLFFLCSTLMLPLSLKSGANTNYYIEWIASLVCLTGLYILRLVSADPPQNVVRTITLSGALLLYIFVQPEPPSFSPAYVPHKVALASLVESTKKDRPIVSDEMVILLRAGREVVWEPAIHAELAAVGRWDPEPFARRVCSGEFGFFVTFVANGDDVYEMRYPQRIRDAIDAAYPLKRAYGNFVVHLPAVPAAGIGRTGCDAS